jgi:hypothetical protein
MVKLSGASAEMAGSAVRHNKATLAIKTSHFFMS